MSREIEVATYLAADPDLAALAPGGVYSDSTLGVAGITDAVTTPDVWAGGTFRASIVVRQRASVPTGQLVDLVAQVSDANQVIECWIYALEMADVEALSEEIYGLMQGHKFSNAWRANWSFGLGILQAPDLPSRTFMDRIDFTIRSLRQPAAA